VHRVRRVLWLDNVLLVVVVSAGGVWGYQRLATDDDRPRRVLPESSTQEAFEPLKALATLDVRAQELSAPYARDHFGQRWADVDRNGCDTRNDILRRDLRAPAFEPGTHDCVVVSGSLVDPYSGETIAFVKGNKTSTDVQIDHVVSLADAWRTGAEQLSPQRRLEFANDPRNLLAVGDASNRTKAAHAAATWLPSNKGFRCDYVARQVAVKAEYGLWVTPAEHDAIAAILEACPS
jgi:hypothetical protein